MGKWTLKYTTGYNANTWTSKKFATYKAGSSNEEITSMSAYFGVAGNDVTYGPGTETNTDWDRVTGNGKPCSLRMFSGSSSATVQVTKTCGRGGSSANGYYPDFSDTKLYTWTFDTPISVLANSTVTIYFEKEAGVLCNGNGDDRKGNVTGVAGVPKRYITYDANGGSNAPDAQECIKGTATTVSSTKPTKNQKTKDNYTVTFNVNTGNALSEQTIKSTKTTTYSFDHWNTKSDGSGDSYSSGASITLTNNITLFAIYSKTTVNNSITTPTATKANTTSTRIVTLDDNDGTSSTTSLKSTATVSHTGKGWYTAASGGEKRCANGGSYTPTVNETIYQQWTSKTGTFSSITLPERSRVGYEFKGWASSQLADEGEYAAGSNYTPSDTITLYAVWSRNLYPVNYDANGGNGDPMETDWVHYGDNFKPKTCLFKREPGYSFKIWNESADGSGVDWKSEVEKIYNYNYGITLYAQWRPRSYTIEYNSNGAPMGTMQSSSHIYQDGSTLSEVEFSYPGYNFIGWSNDPTGAVICSDEGPAPYWLVTYDNQIITLYAIWSQNSPWTLTQVKIYDSANNKWWTC